MSEKSRADAEVLDIVIYSLSSACRPMPAAKGVLVCVTRQVMP